VKLEGMRRGKKKREKKGRSPWSKKVFPSPGEGEGEEEGRRGGEGRGIILLLSWPLFIGRERREGEGGEGEKGEGGRDVKTEPASPAAGGENEVGEKKERGEKKEKGPYTVCTQWIEGGKRGRGKRAS